MPPRKPESLFILIRGLGRESGHWGDFPQRLQAKISHSMVKCVDLPGTGDNLAMRSPIHMRGISEFVRSETEFIKAKYDLGQIDTFVLAPSLGGMIATDWMINYPRDLAGLVLINTSFSSWSTFWERLQPQAYQYILKIILKEKDAYARESEVVKMVSNDKEKFLIHAKAWSEVFAARPILISNILRQLLAANEFSPPRVKVDTPILILSSAEDHMVDPKCSEVIQKVWDCPMHVHPWAGHDIPLDDADWVIEKTLNWYQSLVAERFRAVDSIG